MTSEQQVKSFWDKHGRKIILGAFVFLFALWIIHPFIVSGMLFIIGRNDTPANQGTLGDSYGGLNSLLSGIAMIAAVSAVLIQTFEFKAQREELGLSREQLRLQLEEMQQQREEMSAANKVNQIRLSFDKSVHEYSIRKDFLALFDEFHSDEMKDAKNTVYWLKRTKKHNDIVPYILHALDPNLAPSPHENFRPKDGITNDQVKTSAKRALNLIAFYHRLAISQLEERYFAHFIESICDHREILEDYVLQSQSAFPTAAPPWTYTIPILIDKAVLMAHMSGKHQQLIKETAEVQSNEEAN
ncbi:hypothetical protein ACYFX5_08925 [Bremerella sp. T1]|uniref:hypothetical protein n=1 Tax=Bremerella sp. TYQ1 TaxID=3119568 RepID=UPI001CCEA467|nr:hypothetical protein [Bremerella volcania]UBM38377.1 hypothetical protein LA756_10855 [Bremerella volcania]